MAPGLISRTYTSLAPYLLPVAVAFALVFYFNPPEPEIVTETVTNTEYVTVEVPGDIVTETVTLRDTVRVKEYVDREVTVYLPGETVTVPAVHDTVFITLDGTLDSTETAVQVKLNVLGSYLFPPVNTLTLGAQLHSVSLQRPAPTLWDQFQFRAGLHLRQQSVGINSSIGFRRYSLLLGLDTGGTFIGGQYLIK